MTCGYYGTYPALRTSPSRWPHRLPTAAFVLLLAALCSLLIAHPLPRHWALATGSLFRSPVSSAIHSFKAPPPSARYRLPPLSSVAQPSSALEDEDAPQATATASFQDFGLHPALLPGLRKLRLYHPSEIQQAAIPRALANESLAVQSYTGSGKTVVFLLPMLSEALSILEAGRTDGHVTHLVISPSQELSMQIYRVATELLGPDLRWAVQPVIGGANLERQRTMLRTRQPLLVVGTPGRLAALLGTSVGVHLVQTVALDEADALLKPTFAEDVARVLRRAGKHVPGGPRYLLLSASLTPKALVRMKEAWGLPEIKEVLTTTAPSTPRRPGANMQATMSPTLTHWHVMGEPRTKVDLLRRVLVALGKPRVLVFMNEAKRLKDTLFRLQAITKAFQVSLLHSELPKEARRAAIQGFEKGEVQVLVVTDVLARGMDLACDAVINLELPEDATQYAHRAGRTGRMGKAGEVVTLVCPYETERFAKLVSGLGVPVPLRQAFKGALVEPSTVPGRVSGAKAKGAAHERPVVLKKDLEVPITPLRQWEAVTLEPEGAPMTVPPVEALALTPSAVAKRPPRPKDKKAPWLWKQRLAPAEREALELAKAAKAETERAALRAALDKAP